MIEHVFQCPHCWEEISVFLDPSVEKQIYIEDCEVCCNPIRCTVQFKMGALESFNAESIEQ